MRDARLIRPGQPLLVSQGSDSIQASASLFNETLDRRERKYQSGRQALARARTVRHCRHIRHVVLLSWSLERPRIHARVSAELVLVPPTASNCSANQRRKSHVKRRRAAGNDRSVWRDNGSKGHR